MLAEAFPRLAVRLRSTFPDAQIELVHGESREDQGGLRVGFQAFPAWLVEVTSSACHEQFQIFQSSIVLKYACLESVNDEDFYKFVAAENLGLRGASLIIEPKLGRRVIRIRSNFLGQKGRTRDEAENLAIDTLSLLRFARLLEDRILQSSVGDRFIYEMYYSQYLSKSIGRNRFINYARSLFQGSTERVFGQVAGMLKEDYKYKVHMNRQFVATIHPPDSSLEIILRIPEEIPMITCSASLQACPWAPERSFAMVARLNQSVQSGHFEVNADGSLISFVVWKHLTNDLRYFALDQMIAAVHEAEMILAKELPAWLPTSAELLKANASSLDAYRSAAA